MMPGGKRWQAKVFWHLAAAAAAICATAGATTTTLLLSNLTDDTGAALLPKRTKVVSVEQSTSGVLITLSKEAVDRPWRPRDVMNLVANLRAELSAPATSSVVVRVGTRQLDEYVPPYYREVRRPRSGPSPLAKAAAAPLRQESQPAGVPNFTCGLAGKHIVVWPSHGLYFDKESGRWQWQRPRMFTTVEDRLTMSVVNDYLIPMLERAGATVISCRERDYQTHEVIVDDGDGHDGPMGRFKCAGFVRSRRSGFANGKAPYPENVNPHTLGTTHEWSGGKGEAFARWIPKIPDSGDYAVYVSYAAELSRSSRARYRVKYDGGTKDIFVNQQMGGNMWVYLGTFHFVAGQNEEKGSVELVASEGEAGTLSADAVKFGGGMGSVVREGKPSGYPRYLEAAKYWLQYCGVDSALVYAFGKHAGNDYTEDYISRPEYVNYLVGAPCGPNQNRSAEGKHVPVDVALALHTDASISTGTVGTLAIYRLADETKSEFFPDGRDRMLCRDLADLVQTQLVEDLRAQFCSTWNRRELADRDYAEARRPNVPCVLIEALSHQNYDDIKFALDPQFRKAWARALYKGILRFIATEYGYEPKIAPLPPRLLGARVDNGQVQLEWEAMSDPLEPSAVPEGYVIYRRVADSGFDAGTYVGNKTVASLPLASADPSAVETFCVAAVNPGGISEPSDAFSVCAGRGKRALVVHNFDRLGPPALVASQGQAPNSLGGNSWEGVARSYDRGVADGWNSPLVGDQFDFDRSHAWVGDDSPYTNDHPGHGASYGDLETRVEFGRAKDLAYRHATALAELGYGVDTISAVACGQLSPETVAQRYAVVDFLHGEQRATLPPPSHEPGRAAADRMTVRYEVWTKSLRDWTKALTKHNLSIVVTGAYAITDAVLGANASAESRAFVKDVLRCKWTSEKASVTNNIRTTRDAYEAHLSAGLGEDSVYAVESPGGVAPAHKSGNTLFRYSDSGVGAAVVDRIGNARIAVAAFPLECVTTSEGRREVLRELLKD
ncbi:MAG: N-acetylmuramoyl-L-alanine amidase [Candidatus Sumerlaeaceae bacterium]|nr:N-acetylmuramoyl-L-alanine amidase [Candidatus Sumerlaeaceae bacterium]